MAMIGRAPLGTPGFPQSHRRHRGPETRPVPRWPGAVRPPGGSSSCPGDQKGEKIACLEARKHYAWYLRGVPYSGYWKKEISQIATMADIDRITEGICRELT